MNTVRIFIRRKSYTSLMGRWGMINENNRFADTNIDWANHDHCGGEICNEFFVNKNNEEETKEKENKDNNDNQSQDEKSTKYEIDYYLPYVM